MNPTKPMNPSISRFTLDLQASQSQVSVPVNKNDSGRVWEISISDGNVPYILEDSVFVILSIKMPTGELMESYNCQVKPDKNIIVCDFREMEIFEIVTSAPGIHSCQITLRDGSNQKSPQLGTAAFTMVVHDVGVVTEIELPDEAELKLKDIDAAEAIRRSNEETRIANEARREAIFLKYFSYIPRVVDITRYHNLWEDEVGEDGVVDSYSQVVDIEVTANTKVDLQASAALLDIFHEKDIAFVAENVNGVVKVYAIGDKPDEDYTLQAALKEVN